MKSFVGVTLLLIPTIASAVCTIVCTRTLPDGSQRIGRSCFPYLQLPQCVIAANNISNDKVVCHGTGGCQESPNGVFPDMAKYGPMGSTKDVWVDGTPRRNVDTKKP
jgi:hypothetical protein